MTESEINAILDVARSWVGYLEKNGPQYSYYENKTANSGSKNYTRFGRIFDLVVNGKDKKVTDGAYWCAMFVTACVYESKAGHIDTTQPMGNLTVNRSVVEWMKRELAFGGSIGGLASCDTWKSIFRKHGRLDKNPTKGSFVIFIKGIDDAYHIGIVESVGSNGTYTTIEGNTGGSGNSVNPNGGGVKRLTRSLSKTKALFLHVLPGETTDIPSAGYEYTGDSTGAGQELTPIYGSATNKPNKVTNLSKARNREKGTDPSISENRKKNFDALANTLIEGAPSMGRDIIKSQEMYDTSILKGDQLSKKRISKKNKNESKKQE